MHLTKLSICESVHVTWVFVLVFLSICVKRCVTLRDRGRWWCIHGLEALAQTSNAPPDSSLHHRHPLRRRRRNSRRLWRGSGRGWRRNHRRCRTSSRWDRRARTRWRSGRRRSRFRSRSGWRRPFPAARSTCRSRRSSANWSFTLSARRLGALIWASAGPAARPALLRQLSWFSVTLVLEVAGYKPIVSLSFLRLTICLFGDWSIYLFLKVALRKCVVGLDN